MSAMRIAKISVLLSLSTRLLACSVHRTADAIFAASAAVPILGAIKTENTRTNLGRFTLLLLRKFCGICNNYLVPSSLLFHVFFINLSRVNGTVNIYIYKCQLKLS